MTSRVRGVSAELDPLARVFTPKERSEREKECDDDDVSVSTDASCLTDLSLETASAEETCLSLFLLQLMRGGNRRHSVNRTESPWPWNGIQLSQTRRRLQAARFATRAATRTAEGSEWVCVPKSVGTRQAAQ